MTIKQLSGTAHINKPKSMLEIVRETGQRIEKALNRKIKSGEQIHESVHDLCNHIEKKQTDWNNLKSVINTKLETATDNHEDHIADYLEEILTVMHTLERGISSGN